MFSAYGLSMQLNREEPYVMPSLLAPSTISVPIGPLNFWPWTIS